MPAKLNSGLVALYKAGANDPVFFVEEVIGMTKLWEKQKEIALSVRDNPFTVVKSCNGSGKTFTTANIVAWFLTTKPNSIVISTAPTSRQVRELLWQEIRNIHANSKYFLGGNCTTVSWTLGPKWYALGLSTDEPNRFQGFHAENILGVIDEGAGVDAPIWEGMDSILTSSGARLLAIGNPTEPSGRFFDAFSSPLFNKIHISAFDTPNFTINNITEDDIRTGAWKAKTVNVIYPALVTPQWVSDRLIEWGEESPAYQSRVRGEFPVIGNNTMIPLGWVLKAKERPVNVANLEKCIMAVDVARFGDDESVVAIRRGVDLTRIQETHHVDVHSLSKTVKTIADEENPYVIIVDVVGVGAGVADNLRAWGYNVIDFVAQGKAWEPEKFINRRTEAWFRMREHFRKGTVNIPPDDVLVGQLTAPTYDFDNAGRYRLESKEDMKKRGLKSPDRADAVVMAYDFEGELGSYIAKDYISREIKPNTVEHILSILTNGQEEEIQWHTMNF